MVSLCVWTRMHCMCHVMKAPSSTPASVIINKPCRCVVDIQDSRLCIAHGKQLMCRPVHRVTWSNLEFSARLVCRQTHMPRFIAALNMPLFCSYGLTKPAWTYQQWEGKAVVTHGYLSALYVVTGSTLCVRTELKVTTGSACETTHFKSDLSLTMGKAVLMTHPISTNHAGHTHNSSARHH